MQSVGYLFAKPLCYGQGATQGQFKQNIIYFSFSSTSCQTGKSWEEVEIKIHAFLMGISIKLIWNQFIIPTATIIMVNMFS